MSFFNCVLQMATCLQLLILTAWVLSLFLPSYHMHNTCNCYNKIQGHQQVRPLSKTKCFAYAYQIQDRITHYYGKHTYKGLYILLGLYAHLFGVSGGPRGGKSGHDPPSKLAMEFGPLW